MATVLTANHHVLDVLVGVAFGLVGCAGRRPPPRARTCTREQALYVPAEAHTGQTEHRFSAILLAVAAVLAPAVDGGTAARADARPVAAGARG